MAVEILRQDRENEHLFYMECQQTSPKVSIRVELTVEQFNVRMDPASHEALRKWKTPARVYRWSGGQTITVAFAYHLRDIRYTRRSAFFMRFHII